MLAAEVSAQNSTNSPYSRYGYGEIANRSFGAGRSMGGIGIGLRSSKQINPLNPASYSCMDSLTFLFDFGATGQYSWYTDGVNKQSDINGNVEYMAMQFPIHRKIAVSIGMLPFSHVGYKYGESKVSNGLTYVETFEGSGGLNQLYGGVSIDVWKKRLSVGANLNYIFGTVTHSSTSTFSSENSTYILSSKAFKVGKAYLDYGVQYVHLLSKSSSLTFGATFAPKTDLSARTYEAVQSTVIQTDTVRGLKYEIPTTYGLGVSYEKTDKLIIAADYQYQGWGSVKFSDKGGLFQDRSKVAIGGEYIPNLYSQPYLNRLRYRIGGSYANSYMLSNGNGYKELSATIGAGFPMSDGRSYINVSFEYVKVKPEVYNMVSESYLKMTLSYTFNEYWFFKKKF